MPHVTPGCLATSDTESDLTTAASTPRKHARVLVAENRVRLNTMAGG
jgi:hypothetical protein